LRYLVYWWYTHFWYFWIPTIFMVNALLYVEIFSILMVDVLLILLDTKYFDDLRTVDTLRYLVCWWPTDWLYFWIRSTLMVNVLLILWGIQYVDGWHTVDISGYKVFWWLTYCYTLRYLVILWWTYCWYFWIICIFMVNVLLIRWDT